MRSRGIIIISVTVLFLMLTAQSSQAIVIFGDITGSPNWPDWRGYFEGEFAYEDTSSTTATLTVSLTNKSPIDNHGFLTAFAFNIPLEYGIEVVAFSEDDSSFDWNLLLGTVFTGEENEINAPPFGNDFDIGAAVGTKWTGLGPEAGRPQDGIPVDNRVSFTFDLVGTGLNALSDQSFVDSAPSDGEFFVTRFRGFDDEGSDKIPATTTPIPEPATMILLGSGLLGLAAFGRAKRKRS